MFTRPDHDGRTVVYQAELDIEAPAGGRQDGQPWSYPVKGCYAIQVDGDAFSHVTILVVT
jgi:hypothetical protein